MRRLLLLLVLVLVVVLVASDAFLLASSPPRRRRHRGPAWSSTLSNDAAPQEAPAAAAAAPASTAAPVATGVNVFYSDRFLDHKVLWCIICVLTLDDGVVNPSPKPDTQLNPPVNKIDSTGQGLPPGERTPRQHPRKSAHWHGGAT